MTPDHLALLTRPERRALGLGRESELLARFLGSTLWRVRPGGRRVYRGNGREITLAPAGYGRWSYRTLGQWHGPFPTVAEAKAAAFDQCFRDEIGGARTRRRRVKSREAVA